MHKSGVLKLRKEHIVFAKAEVGTGMTSNLDTSQ